MKKNIIICSFCINIIQKERRELIWRIQKIIKHTMQSVAAEHDVDNNTIIINRNRVLYRRGDYAEISCFHGNGLSGNLLCTLPVVNIYQLKKCVGVNQRRAIAVMLLYHNAIFVCHIKKERVFKFRWNGFFHFRNQ